MRVNGIKSLVSAVLLVAYVLPSTLTTLAYTNSYSTPYVSGLSLSSDVSLTDNNSKITLSLRDSDVKQVLRMFADKAGLNIVFHDSVNGKVTLDLVDTPINEAFSLVLQIANLNYYKQGNTMIVIDKSSEANASYSKQEMMTFPVRYVSAAKIADFLNNNVFSMKKTGLSSVDAATVNSATNELVVFGMPSDAPIIERVIEQFDREPFTRTFTVNHTTPQEMADMICNMLLPSRGVGEANGTATGGAASASGSSSGSSSSGSSLKLGEGTVACSVDTKANSKSVSAFDMQNLSIAYFPQRGTITMMGGSESQARMIENFIKSNDIKQPQAYLELSIVELNEDGSKEFSNNWNFSTKAWNFTFDGASTSGGRMGGRDGNWVPNVERHYEPGKWVRTDEGGTEWRSAIYEETGVKIPAPVGTYISWQMNYLIENKKGRVLANPKLLITNGQESTIDLTQDYVEKVTSEFLTSAIVGTGSSGAVQKNYSIGSDLGIKVTLTPFISPDGYVTLNITPDYSTIANQVYALGNTGSMDLQATLLSRRNLDLKNVRIKDGETLVIGGLIQENEQKTVKKIPVLGDLPLVGAAFRSTNTSKAKTELVIMITPKIINDGDGAVANTL